MLMFMGRHMPLRFNPQKDGHCALNPDLFLRDCKPIDAKLRETLLPVQLKAVASLPVLISIPD